ncbi:hypothetical protein C8A01DRAFT_15561 [Parachaetomium inaequale]|uniref:Short-chain dehydrogenase n=1 Tax=Parachaetomium inaequale TaxID=2588326 RepID=A0AAN6SSE4_9PEZI|nr:hypothetical protein C8A01DRAFT_15561 [Parachaetomium inaequale]
MFRSQLSQFFPRKPAFTEPDVASQQGKVFLVTGGASGIGLEIAKILYQKGGRVDIAGRSEENARRAIRDIQTATPSSSNGSLEYLHLDLSDLTTVQPAVTAFKAKEPALHVLFNNAGVSQPPLGSLSAQDIELQLATNCLGPFLLTQLLLPTLEATAAATSPSAPGTVRVVWTASQMMELTAPPEVLVMSELRAPPKDTTRNYVNSKTGNYLLAVELARQQQQKQTQAASLGSNAAPVLSVSTNPGAASTNLFRHTRLMGYLAWPLLQPARLAALTQLYAGLSGDVAVEGNGCYVVPWGRVAKFMRQDLRDAAKLEEDRGSGRAREFWEFCEEMTGGYR